MRDNVSFLFSVDVKVLKQFSVKIQNFQSIFCKFARFCTNSCLLNSLRFQLIIFNKFAPINFGQNLFYSSLFSQTGIFIC